MPALALAAQFASVPKTVTHRVTLVGAYGDMYMGLNMANDNSTTKSMITVISVSDGFATPVAVTSTGLAPGKTPFYNATITRDPDNKSLGLTKLAAAGGFVVERDGCME
jgi:hypothetical protein